MPAKRILFAGGGTGGHLFPALAIAGELVRNFPGTKICFVGTSGKIEARVVPAAGYEFRTLWISGFRRGFSIGNLLFPLKLAVSMVQAIGHLRSFKPDAVVGTGGYVSGPVLFAASLSGIPTLIHEQNSIPGETTRLLAKRVREIHISFEETRAHLPQNLPVVLSGNPTRRELDDVNRTEAMRFFGMMPDDGRRVVLILGGSLGAHSINSVMLQQIDEIMAANVRLIWQTGPEDYESIKQKTSAVPGTDIRVEPFIDRMDYAYGVSDLVICRAGATTIAELTRLGKPAIFVPYPHAAADHQTLNAKALEAAGAAVVISDKDLPSRLVREYRSLLEGGTLQLMGEKSKKLGKPDAAGIIARRVMDLASQRTGSGG